MTVRANRDPPLESTPFAAVVAPGAEYRTPLAATPSHPFDPLLTPPRPLS